MMWDVEDEMIDLALSLNAMCHLNLVEDVTPPIQSSIGPSHIRTSKIRDSPRSIHDLDLQYRDDEDSFDDM
jgi:hypothetical protein